MKEKYKLGLFIGRFQPLHKGHMHAIRYAAAMCKCLVIGIGSSQEKGTESNPLSAKDRMRIIKTAIRGSRINSIKLRFLEIPDFNDDDKWFGYIIKKEPGIDAVFSRTRLVQHIFHGRNIAVVPPPWYERGRLVATKIRKIIKNGRHWQDRVPKAAVKEIEAHEGEIRRAKGTIIAKRR